MQLALLLDLAKNATGSDANTAGALSVSQARISDYRHGREKCPWKKQLRLCQIAGLTPAETLRHMEELAGNVVAAVAGVGVTLSYGCFELAQRVASHGASAALMYISEAQQARLTRQVST